jgi:hypothetical protein
MYTFFANVPSNLRTALPPKLAVGILEFVNESSVGDNCAEAVAGEDKIANRITKSVATRSRIDARADGFADSCVSLIILSLIGAVDGGPDD